MKMYHGLIIVGIIY